MVVLSCKRAALVVKALSGLLGMEKKGFTPEPRMICNLLAATESNQQAGLAGKRQRPAYFFSSAGLLKKFSESSENQVGFSSFFLHLDR